MDIPGSWARNHHNEAHTQTPRPDRSSYGLSPRPIARLTDPT